MSSHRGQGCVRPFLGARFFQTGKVKIANKYRTRLITCCSEMYYLVQRERDRGSLRKYNNVTAFFYLPHFFILPCCLPRRREGWETVAPPLCANLLGLFFYFRLISRSNCHRRGRTDDGSQAFFWACCSDYQQIDRSLSPIDARDSIKLGAPAPCVTYQPVLYHQFYARGACTHTYVCFVWTCTTWHVASKIERVRPSSES